MKLRSRQSQPEARLHAHRVARRHRDHRGFDRPAASGRSIGPGSGPSHPVHQQPEADRDRDPQLHQRQQRVPAGDHVPDQPLAPAGNECYTSGSWFLAMSQYFEQGNALQRHELQVNVYTPQNATVSAVGQSMLWCPSDSVITNLQFTYPAGAVMATPLTMYYSSYAGNTGSVVPVVRAHRPHPPRPLRLASSAPAIPTPRPTD